MTVIYLDSVFVLNTVMDYLLLLSSARLAGKPLHRARYLLAAVFGGVYAAAVFFPGGDLLALTPVKLLCGVLLALIAFGGQGGLVRMTVLFFALSCALAGCVLAVGLLSGITTPVTRGVFYTDISAPVLLVAATAAYFVVGAIFRASAGRAVDRRMVSLRLCIADKESRFTALLDTGNGLRSGFDSKPVLVLAPETVRSALPPEVGACLERPVLRDPAGAVGIVRMLCPELRPGLLPCRTVSGSGLLLTVQADWLEVGGSRLRNVSLALSPEPLGDGIAALWGGEAVSQKRRNAVAKSRSPVI